MVKTDSGEKKASAITPRLFLNSVKKWHDEDGVHCAINNVGKPVENLTGFQWVFNISINCNFVLERVHIKRASKIIASIITDRKIESSLS